MPSDENGGFSVRGLTVDTDRLDEILTSLSKTINEQSREISKITTLEEQHSRLKRDVQCLELKFSTEEIATNLESYVNNEEYQDESKSAAVSNNSSKTQYAEITSDISSRRRSLIQEQVSVSHKRLEDANLRKIRRDVVGMKASICQLQEDFNVELANSVDLVSQLDVIKKRLVDVEKSCGSSSSSSPGMLETKQMMRETYEKLLSSIRELESRVVEEVDSKIYYQSSKLQKSFHDLEGSLKNRLSLCDSKLSNFARTSDLNALIENFDDETQNNHIRLDFLETGNLRNEQSLVQMQQKSAFLTIKKCNMIWKKRMQVLTWERWQQYVKADIEEKSRAIERKRKIRQLLIRHWYSRKKKTWGKWQLFLQWHRRIESLKYQALTLIHNKMERALTIPVRNAFNQLRRHTISEKMSEDRLLQEKETFLIKNQRAENPTDVYPNNSMKDKEDMLVKIQSNRFELSELLNTFRNDKDGAIHTLAQAVNNMKIYDISRIRRDMMNGDTLLNESFHRSLSNEVCSLEAKIDSLEKKVDDNFQCLSNQLPEMKRHISELRNSLHGAINRVKIIEQTHRDRIELLCESKEISDEKIAELESNLQDAQAKIKGLKYNNDRSQNLINTLLGKMNDFERNHMEEKKNMTNSISLLQNDLMVVHSRLATAEEQRKTLNENLNATKHELIQSKIAIKASFDNVHSIFDTHGISKPKLKMIVDDGILYEKIAKEKNYVVQLNCISDGIKEVEVASHIASFAHDCAAWISFQADHEALQLVVIGNNPDDAIYVEDEMEARRKNLTRNLKEELEESLDQAYPDAGAVRLEARARYIARVVDAIEAALSKHDQVFIPATTRLGRVRASVPTCVACDRPLTNRGKRNIDVEDPETIPVQSKPSSRPKLITSAAFANAEVKPFVMRGGFRMPSTN